MRAKKDTAKKGARTGWNTNRTTQTSETALYTYSVLVLMGNNWQASHIELILNNSGYRPLLQLLHLNCLEDTD